MKEKHGLMDLKKTDKLGRQTGLVTSQFARVKIRAKGPLMGLIL